MSKKNSELNIQKDVIFSRRFAATLLCLMSNKFVYAIARKSYPRGRESRKIDGMRIRVHKDDPNPNDYHTWDYYMKFRRVPKVAGSVYRPNSQEAALVCFSSSVRAYEYLVDLGLHENPDYKVLTVSLESIVFLGRSGALHFIFNSKKDDSIQDKFISLEDIQSAVKSFVKSRFMRERLDMFKTKYIKMLRYMQETGDYFLRPSLYTTEVKKDLDRINEVGDDITVDKLASISPMFRKLYIYEYGWTDLENFEKDIIFARRTIRTDYMHRYNAHYDTIIKGMNDVKLRIGVQKQSKIEKLIREHLDPSLKTGTVRKQHFEDLQNTFGKKAKKNKKQDTSDDDEAIQTAPIPVED